MMNATRLFGIVFTFVGLYLAGTGMSRNDPALILVGFAGFAVGVLNAADVFSQKK